MAPPAPPLSLSPAPRLGLYLAVPFCRSKCSFCNFASQVHPAHAVEEYCTLLARELDLAAAADGLTGATLDTVYWGGGTPTLLPPSGVAAVNAALRRNFRVAPDAEHTIEAAPGTLTEAVLEAWLAAGVNRVSFGVQSFVESEARAVGRRQSPETIAADLERLRRAGLANLSLDLIAGLPGQTAASWRDSVAAALAAGVPHASIYMLEVDEDSRLGNELLAGGARYHAHAVPDDDQIADAYEYACAALPAAGLVQYEISNFARPGFESRHNLAYWQRRPYLGVGLDAHSFLPVRGPAPARRFANPDALEAWSAALRQHRLPRLEPVPLTPLAAAEETLFLGLRRTSGLERAALEAAAAPVPGFAAWLEPRLARLEADGLLESRIAGWSLTPRGRLLSNLVFGEFLGFSTGEHDTLTACADASAPRA